MSSNSVQNSPSAPPEFSPPLFHILCIGLCSTPREFWGVWQNKPKGTNRAHTLIFADFRHFLQKQSIWETQLFAENRRSSQKTAENQRNPQKTADRRLSLLICCLAYRISKFQNLVACNEQWSGFFNYSNTPQLVCKWTRAWQQRRLETVSVRPQPLVLAIVFARTASSYANEEAILSLQTRPALLCLSEDNRVDSLGGLQMSDEYYHHP